MNLMQAEMFLFLCAHHFNFLSVSMWMEGYLLQTSYFGFHIPQDDPFVAYAHTLSGIGCHQGCSGSSGTNVGLEVASWGGNFQTIQGLTSQAAQVPPVGMTVSNQGSACQYFSCDPKKQPPVPPTESWLSTGMFLQARDFAVSPHSV